MSVTLVHNFHTQTSTVQNVCPGVQDFVLTINDGLVEVETIQVECHRADAKCSEPDADNSHAARKKCKRTGVVEGCVLEDQTTEVTVCSNDVVGLFFLTELVTIVLGLGFGGLTNQRRSNQTSVHCREQRTTEHPSNTEHMERVHKDVVFCLEDKHVVKSTRDTKRHSIGERTLTERIDEEDSRCCCNRCSCMQHRSKDAYQDGKRVPTHDPCKHRCRSGSGRQRVGKDHHCTTIHRGMRFPNGVEVKSNCVGRGNNCTRDDVVTIHERTSNGFTNAIDVHRRSSDEGDDEADGCCKQRWDHQNAEPTNIETVVCGSHPFAE